MLTLADASRYFDKTPIRDTVSGSVLFYGQVDPYGDAIRDSGTAYRRILSVAPGTTIPSSRLVSILGSTWIVGDSETDGMQVAHREKYVLHPAPTLIALYRLTGHLSSTLAESCWGDMVWFKDGKEEASSSRVVPMYTLYLPATTSLQEFDVVHVGVRAYLVQNPHTLPSGAASATCVQLEHALATATLNTRVYDPVQGKYVSTAPTSVPCQRVRWQSLYVYDEQVATRYQEGDCSLVLPAGTTVATKDTITLAGATWSVLSVETISGAVVAHGRPA